MKPSDVKSSLMGSPMRKSEYEIILGNVITMLKNTGDKFREFSFSDYYNYREKSHSGRGGRCGPRERSLFLEMVTRGFLIDMGGENVRVSSAIIGWLQDQNQ